MCVYLPVLSLDVISASALILLFLLLRAYFRVLIFCAYFCVLIFVLFFLRACFVCLCLCAYFVLFPSR